VCGAAPKAEARIKGRRDCANVSRLEQAASDRGGSERDDGEGGAPSIAETPALRGSTSRQF
jgi:hypothetical protein